MSRLEKGINDFETWCLTNGKMDMLEAWDYEKNAPILPCDVAYGTAKKFWWIGLSCGHSYIASMNRRTSENTACPYCCESHAKLLKGFNDLATTNPELLSSWDYEKNQELLPDSVMKGQHKKVWWKGECGHSWQASIYHRVQGQGCPICRKESQTSFPEQAIYFYLSKYFDDVELGNRSVLEGKELDIYIPSKKIAVEFDGSHWHKSAKKDNVKNELCQKYGINLYRIRDIDTPELKMNDYITIINHRDYSDACLQKCIKELFMLLNIKTDVDLCRDRNKIYSQYIAKKKENSLASKFPDIASEWDYEKNVSLTPDMVTSSSDKKVWWIGKCGHSWQTVVHARTRSKSGCPYCNSNRLLVGFNDLETINPGVLELWDYELNTVSPQEVNANSVTKVWWSCSKCGYTYERAICRQIQLNECLGCARKKYEELTLELNDENIIDDKNNIINSFMRKTFNDTLEKTNPELLEEWDYEKNIVLPSELTRGSDAKVWWRCGAGHSYDASISNRILGRKCPYCSNRKILIGYNDLATTDSDLLEYWDYEKNVILPTQISRNSGKKVWWKCSKGHSRQVSVYSYKPGSCPICSGTQKVRVINCDTNIIYSSLEDAAKSCGLKQGDTISLCCKGKQKTAGGYRWKYCEENS